MRFDAVDFVMQDIGTQAHTQFENGTDLIDILEANPELRGCRMGLIHSHNNMKCWFSGEDLDELDDNSEGTDFYLSLIVNNKFEPCAKIAFRGTQKKEGFTERMVKLARKDEWYSVREDVNKMETVLYAIDVDIFVPELTPLDDDIKRYQELQKSKYSKGGGYGGQFSHPDYTYDKKAGEHNSGPPSYISERQKQIEFNKGNKEDQVAQIDFLMFMGKWITTDYLFEGTVAEAVSRVARTVGTHKPDVQLYTSLVIDNLINYFEHTTGKIIMGEQDELVVCELILSILKGFEKFAVIEALIEEMKEHIEGVKMGAEEMEGVRQLVKNTKDTEVE